MTDRARILGLMALQEKARGATLLSRVADLTRKLADCNALLGKLGEMVAQRRTSAATARLVSDLQSDRHLTAQLMAETDRQQQRRAELARDLAAAQAELAAQEHRRDTLADKAKDARRQSRDDRQARADAALPPRQAAR